MKSSLLEIFIKLIANQTGLQIREQDIEALYQKISLRMKSLKLSAPEQYYHLLESQNEASREEWQKLIILLTTTESYFFRDRGQFKLLKNTILPELIRKKRLSNNKTLRLWSAGCSTGEEAYSLAILVRKLIPDLEEWKILVLGTDINKIVIEKAQKGIYSDWSFRQVDFSIQTKYFHRVKEQWKLDDVIRKMVTFNIHNLARDKFPENIDLILCRNVFVYFENTFISLVMNNFYKALKLEGFLIVAHAELFSLPIFPDVSVFSSDAAKRLRQEENGLDRSLQGFEVKVFPESLVYQKSKNMLLRDSAGEKSSILNHSSKPVNKQMNLSENDSGLLNPDNIIYPLLSPPVTSNIIFSDTPRSMDFSGSQEKSTKTSKNQQGNFFDLPLATQKVRLSAEEKEQITSELLLEEAETFFQNKVYAKAIERAEKAIALNPKSFTAYYLLAQTYANLGGYDRAEIYCRKALEVDSLSVAPYYLLVHIAEERGDREAAKNFLKKIIYLFPSSISAYLELADIYEHEGDVNRAKKMKYIALDLLKKLPENALVEYRGEIAASEFIEYLKKLLLNK